MDVMMIWIPLMIHPFHLLPPFLHTHPSHLSPSTIAKIWANVMRMTLLSPLSLHPSLLPHGLEVIVEYLSQFRMSGEEVERKLMERKGRGDEKGKGGNLRGANDLISVRRSREVVFGDLYGFMDFHSSLTINRREEEFTIISSPHIPSQSSSSSSQSSPFKIFIVNHQLVKRRSLFHTILCPYPTSSTISLTTHQQLSPSSPSPLSSSSSYSRVASSYHDTLPLSHNDNIITSYSVLVSHIITPHHTIHFLHRIL